MDVYREKLAQLLAEAELEEFAKGLDLGIELNGPLADGETLTQKAYRVDQNLLQVLLEHGAKLDIPPESLEEESLLRLARTIPDLQQSDGVTNLMIAAVQVDPGKLVEYLRIPGVHLDKQDKEKETALIYAIKLHRWANIYLITQLRGLWMENFPPEYYQWMKDTENYIHLPKITPMSHSEIIQFVRRIMTLEPKPRIINTPLMQSILLGQELSVSANTPLYKENVYGKTVFDLFRFLPNPERQTQLFPAWLKQVRYIAYLDGPLMLKVLRVNGTLCLLFGETHQINNRSEKTYALSMEKFYQGLFASYPACLDFFLETADYQHHPNQAGLETKNSRRSTHPLANSLYNLIIEYYTCVGVEKTGCVHKYPTTRFHNIEFRRHADSLYNHSATKDHPFIYGERFVHGSQMEHLREVFKSLLEGNLEDISSAILQFKDVAKDSKEAELYTPKMLAEKTAYLKMSKQLRALPKKIQRNAREILLAKFEEMMQQNHDSPENISFEYGVLINDTFTLFRMLKTIYVYKTSLITFYGGAGHAYNLTKFFLQLGISAEINGFGFETEAKILAEVRRTGKFPVGEIKLVQPYWSRIIDLIQEASLYSTSCQVNGK